MKNNIKLMSFSLSLISLTCILSGCSSTDNSVEKPEVIESGYTDYDKILDEGEFYVRHSDGTYEKTYLGKAAFASGNVNTEPDPTKVAWYKDDFDNIPTLYEGDSLIFYTQEELNETFTYERFKDYGYSIGLRNLEVTPSGRYAVKTEAEKDEKKIIAYPEGDTSEIEQLTNKNVIIDTIGGVKIRDNKDDENAFSFLTEAGTIGGLEEGATYRAEIYEGTIQHVYNFTADVRILGETEVIKSTDYDFESTTIIHLNIPESWNSGYYMINGKGLFRYVKGDSYDDNTDFNIPNETDSKSDGDKTKPSSGKNDKSNDDKTSQTTVTDNFYKNKDGENVDPDKIISNGIDEKKTYDSAKTYATQDVNIDESGKVYINITFTGEYPKGISAVIGEKESSTGYKFERVGDTLQAVFNAEPGTYIIYYYSDSNTEVNIDKVSITRAYDKEDK